MEYVPSRSLAQAIREFGPMSPERAARVGLAMVDALSRRARRRRAAPRCQARQRAARQRRPGHADRLRARDVRGDHGAADPDRHRLRLAAVHRAGTRARRHLEPGRRHVVARRHALRRRRGPRALLPPEFLRDARRHGHRAARPAAARRRHGAGADRAAQPRPAQPDAARGSAQRAGAHRDGRRHEAPRRATPATPRRADQGLPRSPAEQRWRPGRLRWSAHQRTRTRGRPVAAAESAADSAGQRPRSPISTSRRRSGSSAPPTRRNASGRRSRRAERPSTDGGSGRHGDDVWAAPASGVDESPAGGRASGRSVAAAAYARLVDPRLAAGDDDSQLAPWPDELLTQVNITGKANGTGSPLTDRRITQPKPSDAWQWAPAPRRTSRWIPAIIILVVVLLLGGLLAWHELSHPRAAKRRGHRQPIDGHG